jgi:DNA ligase (NAD+)
LFGDFNIDGLGPRIVERFIEEGLVSDPSDLFNLKEGDIFPLERFADKSAQKIVANIQAKKKVPFYKYIYALGIRNVGQKTSRDLTSIFKTIDDFKKAKFEDFENIEGIGPKVAESIVEWFKDQDNVKFLNKLEKAGVEYFSEKNVGNKLKGKSFVITGTMEKLSREEAKEKIVSLGGEVSSAISKNIDYLVLGENPGSKYEKAQKLAIKILNEKEFLKIIQ